MGQNSGASIAKAQTEMQAVLKHIYIYVYTYMYGNC